MPVPAHVGTATLRFDLHNRFAIPVLAVPGPLAFARHEALIAVVRADGTLLGSGHNRRVQNDDPSVHGETDAFRNAGRQRDYRSTIMVTTLSPCWYCSGLVRQFNIGAVIIGEARTFSGGHDWLAEHGVRITLLDDQRCVSMMTDFIAANPALWNEDIGVSE